MVASLYCQLEAPLHDIDAAPPTCTWVAAPACFRTRAISRLGRPILMPCMKRNDTSPSGAVENPCQESSRRVRASPAD
jgi:hypothetical protein